MKRTVALICTSYNCKDELGIALRTFTSDSNLELLSEIIIVDGGSKDGTWEVLSQWAQKIAKMKVYQVSGANISQGRNEAIERTDAEVIVTFDSGTQYDADWLRLILQAFEDESVRVVGGLTICCGETMFEKCFAALGDQKRAAIKPSHRGCAFYREVWEKIGGYPEHVRAGEDTWFNTQGERMGYKYVNVPEAKNYWKVRGRWKDVFRMQRRNTKGHIALGESSGTIRIFLITAIYLVVALSLILGFYDYRIWYGGAGLYVSLLIKGLLGKGRWHCFAHPARFIVGFYVLTGSDLGTSLGAIEGFLIFLWLTTVGRKA